MLRFFESRYVESKNMCDKENNFNAPSPPSAGAASVVVAFVEGGVISSCATLPGVPTAIEILVDPR